MISSRLAEPAENITSVVSDWLIAEVATSSRPDDANVMLNNYSAAVRGLTGGFEHEENYTWETLNRQLARLEHDYKEFSEITPDDKDFERLAAQVVFDGLMHVSGSYRNQCYVEAQDAEDYMQLRRRAVGVNVANTVRNRLIDWLPENGDFSQAKLGIQGLGKQVEDVSRTARDSTKRMISRLTLGYDLKQPHSRSSQEMLSAQFNWLNLVTDSLIVIAQAREGDYTAVPFMEPVAYEEQSGALYYPLREPVDWAEELGIIIPRDN